MVARHAGREGLIHTFSLDSFLSLFRFCLLNLLCCLFDFKHDVAGRGEPLAQPNYCESRIEQVKLVWPVAAELHNLWERLLIPSTQCAARFQKAM